MITSLGKEHAFAIIVEAQSCDAMLEQLLAAPKLTSFVCLREPIVESLESEQLHRILHPTFVPWEPKGPGWLVSSGKKLTEYLPENESFKVSYVTVRCVVCTVCNGM